MPRKEVAEEGRRSSPGLPRVLAVTREPAVVRIAAQASLEAYGAMAETCADVVSAGRAVRAQTLALVVLDGEGLPKSDRAWLIEEIHRRQSRCAIVYVAPRNAEAIERTARLHGVEVYATRPLEPARLKEQIRRLVAA